MKRRVINILDLFAGGGGASTGIGDAIVEIGYEYEELAINHCQCAVNTMRANHPNVNTLNMDLLSAVPAEVCDMDVIDLAWASPSCTHHSRAKGGKPRQNQLRSQPELLHTWSDQRYIKRWIVENVPEIMEWGPLGINGQPLKSRKGECFRWWIDGFRKRNYIVDWRIINCADYGDATSRRRFFLQAVKRGCGKIYWPEQTHAENPQPDLFGHELKPWRGIRECLDMSDLGTSIFNRKKPLAKNTMRRICAGLRKFCGIDFQMDMFGADGDDDSRIRPLSKPMVTQHAGGNRTAIVHPYIVRLNKNCGAESIDAPISTVTAGGQHHALVQPFVVKMRSHATAGSVDEPLSTITGHTVNHLLATPYIVPIQNNGKPQTLDKPLPTQTTKNHMAMVTPFIMTEQANNAPRSIEKPIRAQTTVRKDFVCTPLVIGQQACAAARPATEPCPTIATAGAVRMITPMVFDNANGGVLVGSDKPINTVTAKDNHMAAFPIQLPDGRLLDVFLRMLKVDELAAAHSFPKGYIFTGTKTEQTKQIGNSVPVRTAKALVLAALSDFRKTKAKENP